MIDKDIKLEEILKSIVPVDRDWIGKAREHTAQLVMPPRALGRLHDISERLCGISKNLSPSINKKAVLVMAGDHGVVDEGVSAFPQDVTGAMVATFLKGGAGINAICRHVGAEVWVVDMGIMPELDPDSIDGGDRLLVHKIAKGTSNFVKGPAMTRKEAEKAILTGFKLATEFFNKGIEKKGVRKKGSSLPLKKGVMKKGVKSAFDPY